MNFNNSSIAQPICDSWVIHCSIYVCFFVKEMCIYVYIHIGEQCVFSEEKGEQYVYNNICLYMYKSNNYPSKFKIFIFPIFWELQS